MWISIDDRKPEIGDFVLAIVASIDHHLTITSRRVALAEYLCRDGREGFFYSYDPGDGWANYAPLYHVTHWTPIPDMPPIDDSGWIVIDHTPHFDIDDPNFSELATLREIEYKCKKCGRTAKEPTKFCPNCGARNIRNETWRSPHLDRRRT